ncbi:vesicular-fusion protein SEC18-like [Hibiscus syriacus]|uniref:vesicular-fusion protein SEC18-like n=1 Tax=Hibiscus syriacus TaxID=106335 RepID=UPI001921336D|nr:vesicular-fusion protein SEC18-like [Hibiscus syriacus]
MVSPNTNLKFTKSMVFNWNLDLKSGGLGCLGGLQKQYDEIYRRLILDLESAGLGGLQKQYDEIYRRLILQRAIPPEMLEKGLKVRYTKGLLLYGPAGTGKTALSNVISLHLSNQRAKIIRGPGVLNEDGGESRRVVMEIFEDAKRDFKIHGNNSRIHVIIFDDLDLIAKRKDGRCTEWRDTLVNQLFSMINDPDGLDNILVIGTTNRIDLIDPYILRSGRFEVCIEMPLYQRKIGDFADKVWETTGAISPKNHLN